VPILVKIDKEMRPWKCSQTDRQTDRQTDANRFYNMPHAICYSYGTYKNFSWVLIAVHCSMTNVMMMMMMMMMKWML